MYNFTLKVISGSNTKLIENFSSSTGQVGCDEIMRLLKVCGIEAKKFGQALGRRIVEKPNFIEGRVTLSMAAYADDDQDLIELIVCRSRVL